VEATIIDFFLLTLLCRTFTQVSSQWQDTDTMREELDDLQVAGLPLFLLQLLFYLGI
jgi:hypothetical protein